MKVRNQSLNIVLIATIAFLGLSSFATQPSTTSAQTWEHLGSKKVNFGLDKDVVRVTRAEGKFTKLRLKVTGGSLTMHRMVVVYGNGNRDEISVKHNFGRGTTTRVIDLNGNRRVIKEVIFWYDTKNRSRKRATMHVFGRH